MEHVSPATPTPRPWPGGLYAGLAIASAAYCLMLLAGPGQWGRGDWDQFTFHYALPRTALLHDGQLPLWNPYVNGGTVLLEHPHCPALSPWYLPTLLLGVPLGLRLQVLLLMIVGTTGMAALLRRWGVSTAGAALGGILLMMSGHLALHLAEGHLEWTLLGVVPWVFWCLDRAGDDRRMVLLGGLLVASAIFGGSVYIVLVFGPLALVWSIFESLRRRTWRPAAHGLGVMLLAGLLGAVVLLPRVEFLRANPRRIERRQGLAPALLPRMLLEPRQARLYRATRDFRNPPDEILAPLLARNAAGATWRQVDVAVGTTSEWCRVEVLDTAYVFVVPSPDAERQSSVPFRAGSLAIEPSRRAGASRSMRATLCFADPPDGPLRLRVRQGAAGVTTLRLGNQGRTIPLHGRPPASPGQTTEYLLPAEQIRQELPPLAEPLRWRLDRQGMTYDWHEYACYLTWLGLALAILGVAAAWRRQWPLIAMGMVAAAVVLGAWLPIDVWRLWQHLPLCGSLQGSTRFLAAVVFVAAVGAAYGLDRLGAWSEAAGGPRLRRAVEAGAVLIVYVELVLLGWNLFGDVFVCPPRPVPPQDAFAQRYRDDEVRYAAMYSAHLPYLQANSGVLRAYENIAVPQGAVRIERDADYRGEAYLADAHGTARIAAWSMARVAVHLEPLANDRLVLNQNYFRGWKAAIAAADGTIRRLPAEPSDEGLVSVAVGPRDREVTLYYLPDSFLWGSAISGMTLVGCLGWLIAGLLRRRRRRTR